MKKIHLVGLILTLAATFARGDGALFTGSGDAQPAVGNATHVVTLSAAGIQISGGTPEADDAGPAITDLGPSSIVSELGAADFSITFTLDASNTGLPAPTLGPTDSTTFGLGVSFDSGGTLFLGVAGGGSGSNLVPFLRYLDATTSKLRFVFTSFTGIGARITVTRTGDLVTLSTPSGDGALPIELPAGASALALGFFATAEAGPIPPTSGKIARVEIFSGAIVTNINNFTATRGLAGWEELPVHGGNIINGIVIDPNDPNHLIALAGGGRRFVIQSLDAGETWHKGLLRNNSSFLDEISNTESLFYASDQTTIYAGKFISRDNGVTWVPIGGLPLDAWVTARDPIDNQVLYASRRSELTAPRDLLFKTTDGGANWIPMGLNLANSWAPGVVVHQSNSNIVLASVLALQGGLANVAGIYRSTDGGANFVRVHSAPENHASVSGVIQHPAAPNVFFAVSQGGRGVWRSADDGLNWTQVVSGRDAHAVAPHPTDPNTVYAFTDSGEAVGLFTEGFRNRVLKSTDGGLNFTRVSTAEVPYPQFAFSAAIDVSGALPVFYIGGFVQGIWKSVDDGITWEEKNTGIRDNSVDFFTEAPNDPLTLFVGTSRGLVKATLSSSGVAIDLDTGVRAVARKVVFDRFNANLALLIIDNNTFTRTTDGGASWEAPSDFGSLLGSGQLKTLAIYSSRSTSGRFLVSGRLQTDASMGGIFVTADGGVTFSPTPTLDKPATRIDSGFLEGAGEVLYAGLGGIGVGGIFRSTDDGATWTDRGLPELAVLDLVVDPGNGDRVFVNGFEPTKIPLYRTTDGGITWEDITPGAIGDLEFDPEDSNTIFMASGDVIRRSTDGGDTWEVAFAALDNVRGIHISPVLSLPGQLANVGESSIRPAGVVLSPAPEGRLFSGTNGSLYSRFDTLILNGVASWSRYR